MGQPGCNSPSIETRPCSGRCETYGDWTDWKNMKDDIFIRSMNCLDSALITQKLNPCKLDMNKVKQIDCSSGECAKWTEWEQWTDQRYFFDGL